MKDLHFIAALILISLQLNAQKAEFVFDQELNNLIVLKEGASPYVFEILPEKHTTIIKKSSEKRTTEFYKKALAYYEKAKADYERSKNLNEKSDYAVAVKNRLETAERILQRTKKYEVIPGRVVVEEHEDLIMRRSIFKPQDILIGKFKYLGAYYVTNGKDGYTERGLISVAEAKQRALTEEQLFLNNDFHVIQNLETNMIYMVYPDFLEKYPINQVASQDKYRGKITVSDAYATNEIDKKLDALIVEYNRKKLNLI